LDVLVTAISVFFALGKTCFKMRLYLQKS